jgi:flavorubredoxin
LSLIREVKPGVLWVGAIDWDRRLFDSLIPLPDGTSYNSYLVKGSEKTALIDAVDATMAKVLIDNLNTLGVKSWTTLFRSTRAGPFRDYSEADRTLP